MSVLKFVTIAKFVSTDLVASEGRQVSTVQPAMASTSGEERIPLEKRKRDCVTLLSLKSLLFGTVCPSFHGLQVDTYENVSKDKAFPLCKVTIILWKLYMVYLQTVLEHFFPQETL